ncbi:MAG: hypothetical protein HY595_03720, partial [Candidatus Omnitrophica bacterium]|nr:hypothetical protein [Candidatus Omnitrophota bacterium]
MQRSVFSWMVASVMIAAAPIVLAEEGSKTLPTLLIKGEVVSLDTNDPTAALLKVKDRYGFETPIYLSQETKIAKGDQAVNAADLAQGLAVEVEYTFDINTAKRHAVNVKVTSAEAPADVAAAAPMAPVAPPAEMPAAPAVDVGAVVAPEAAPADAPSA